MEYERIVVRISFAGVGRRLRLLVDPGCLEIEGGVDGIVKAVAGGRDGRRCYAARISITVSLRPKAMVVDAVWDADGNGLMQCQKGGHRQQTSMQAARQRRDLRSHARSQPITSGCFYHLPPGLSRLCIFVINSPLS